MRIKKRLGRSKSHWGEARKGRKNFIRPILLPSALTANVRPWQPKNLPAYTVFSEKKNPAKAQFFYKRKFYFLRLLPINQALSPPLPHSDNTGTG
ncbi:MAG TPA: hypothetical protein PK971_10580, partial [Saprospiraceae bacterium]|nr:hypothetical protein [Saprospiraceae bacterium]